MTKDSAFDETVKNVEYIIHIASPLPTPIDNEEAEIQIVQPAIRGTLSILKLALREPLVKRVVITLFIGVIIPTKAFAPGYEGIFTDNSRTPNRIPPYNHFMMAYSALKVAAYNASLVTKPTPRL